MNDVKTTFYKTLNIIVGTNRVDNEEAYIINDYISRLEETIKDEQHEIENLNNIINELEKFLKINSEKDDYDLTEYNKGVNNAYNYILDKLKELKEKI